MANLAGKSALVLSSREAGADAAAGRLLAAVVAGLEEAAASVRRADLGNLSQRLEAPGVGARVDVLVADLVLLTALADSVAAAVSRPGLLVGLAGAAATGFQVRALADRLAPRTALALRPATPGVTGRCVAALAMDPDIAEKAGGLYGVVELAREYRFTDPDRPDPLAHG